MAEAVEQLKAPLDSQTVNVASLRTHPYYSVSPIRDDVAVLRLGEPLNLAGPGVKAIPLVATGATPAAGTALSLSGFGKQNGAPTAAPNWRLYSTALTAVGSDACRELVGTESAVTLCASGPASSACQGDSGGPLTEGSPAVEVATVDYGLAGCPAGASGAFANVAAPEVRAFIEGSEAPPVAPRQTAPAVIKVAGPPAVTFSPQTCEPGGWTGSPSFSYTFENEAATPQVFQSGFEQPLHPPRERRRLLDRVHRAGQQPGRRGHDAQRHRAGARQRHDPAAEHDLRPQLSRSVVHAGDLRARPLLRGADRSGHGDL